MLSYWTHCLNDLRKANDLKSVYPSGCDDTVLDWDATGRLGAVETGPQLSIPHREG